MTLWKLLYLCVISAWVTNDPASTLHLFSLQRCRFDDRVVEEAGPNLENCESFGDCLADTATKRKLSELGILA